MGQFAAAMLGVVWCLCARAGEPIPQPDSCGTNFAGAALELECVAALQDANLDHFVASFRAKSASERAKCLDQLLQSLTPEPDFTAADFERALKRNPYGKLELAADPPMDRKMADRLGVNLAVAPAVEALANFHLIDSAAVVGPLVACLDYPLLEAGRHCFGALLDLTGHSYGYKVWMDQSGGPPTMEERRDALSDWQRWRDQLTPGRPIVDEALMADCQAALKAAGSRVLAVLKNFPEAAVGAGYLQSSVEHGREFSIIPNGGFLYQLDVGAHNADNWISRKVTRLAVAIDRPGISDPASSGVPWGFMGPPMEHPSYREVFPALDVEFVLEIDADDPAIGKAAAAAAKAGLAGLREVNERASH